VRTTVSGSNSEQPVFDIKTMDARLDDALAKRRAPMLLLGDLQRHRAPASRRSESNGVLAFSVGQRRQEIGIAWRSGAQRP